MTFAAIIDPDGTIVYRHLTGLDDMQRTVEGYIEATPVLNAQPITVYACDEGKIRGLPVNPLASAVGGLYPHDWIVGNAIIVGEPDADGNDTDLTAEIAFWLNDMSQLWCTARRDYL
jgi:hypothetical protein